VEVKVLPHNLWFILNYSNGTLKMYFCGNLFVE